jgi:hypothetical protein
MEGYMKFSVSARALTVLAASASLLVVPLALPTAAATGATCKKASEKTVGGKLVFSVAQCTPTAATGGSGSGPVSGAKPGQTSGTTNVTVTWAQHKGTTKATVHFKGTTLGQCPVGSTRLKITGSITGGTGTAFKTIKKGQALSGSVCLAASGSISLEKGTVIKF